MEPEPPSVPSPLADPGDIAGGSSRTGEVMASRPSRVRVAAVAAALTAAWITLVVWVNESTPGVPQVDSQLHAWALDHRTDMTIHLARTVSWFGQTNITLPLVVLGGLAATVSTRRFGRLGARVRQPQGDWGGSASGFALPSGHTTAATMAAGLIAWAVTRRLTTKPARAGVWVVAAGWAGAVGWSRVWLGVHWPTDVLCGWLFAASFLLAARAVQLTWWPADAPPKAVLDH